MKTALLDRLPNSHKVDKFYYSRYRIRMINRCEYACSIGSKGEMPVNRTSRTTPATRAGQRPRPVHGARIGIMVLDTEFERIPGDIGNAASFDFPVQYKVVRGASADKVIAGGGEGLLEPFLEAADELVASGVDAIGTSCGFLSVFQKELAARCPVPIATSSIMQVPFVQSMLPAGKRVGIVTYDAQSLTDRHFLAIGVDPATPKAGLPENSEFRRAVGGGWRQLNEAVLLEETLDVGKKLLGHHPDVGAIVIECGNMPPYSAELARHLGVPVYDVVTLVNWLHSGLRPQRFPRY
ncbi:aspartate/glutamate racemase family protein [Mesorhizobium sp. M1423]|uniref:aspartate/glutamate racemase family protein n=1 Tax=Mesorhizobium sp. M1423 TaxID=2957101 RepID=UPI00333B63E1